MSEPPHGSARRLVFLVKLIGEGPARFTLGELAARAGLPQSTVHRYLQALGEYGLVERSGAQSYRIGRELHRIATLLLMRFDLVRNARPMLEDLVGRFNETAVLCTYNPLERHVVVTDCVPSSQALRFAIDQGMEIELVWGSLGRSILAFLPANEIEVVLRESGLGPLSGRPRMPRELMMTEIGAIRAKGYSRFCEESIEVAGMAAPIFGPENKLLGCIGVTMPASRFQQADEAGLAEAICAAATRVTGMALDPPH